MARVTGAVRRLRDAYAQDSGPAMAATLLLVGGVTTAIGMVDLWTDAPWGGPATDIAVAWHLIPLVVGCLGLLARRTRPGLALGVAVAAFVVDAAIGGSVGLLLVLVDGLYAAERFGGPGLQRTVRFGAGLVTVATAVAGVVGGLPMRAVAALTLQNIAILAVPIWWAHDVRHRSDLADAVQAQLELEAARAAEHARALHAEQRSAVQAERTRMAQELHDAVAGDVSALVIRAGAALAAPPGPADRAALADIRESGLQALDELRSMIDVLTADGVAEPVAPVLTADGDALLERSAVVVRCADVGELPSAVDRAAYRILQEALTNATKHGSGPAVVAIARDRHTLTIEVTNAVAPGNDRDTGLGMSSMTERAHAVGGTLTTATDDERWRLTLRLPTTQGERA